MAPQEIRAESNLTETELMEKILYQKIGGKALHTNANVLENLQVYKSKPQDLFRSNPHGLFLTHEAFNKSHLNDGSYWQQKSGPKTKVYSSTKPAMEIAYKSSFRFIDTHNVRTFWVIEDFMVKNQIWRLAKLIESPLPAKRKTSTSNVSKSQMSAAPMNEGFDEGSGSFPLRSQHRDYDRGINHDGEDFEALGKMVSGNVLHGSHQIHCRLDSVPNWETPGILDNKMVSGNVLHGSHQIHCRLDSVPNWETPGILDNSFNLTDYLVDNVAEVSQVAVRSGVGVGEESKKLKLYSDGLSSCSCSVLICLKLLNKLKGIDYEYNNAVSLDKGYQCSPDFLNLNPLGYVPVLVDGDMVIRDSFPILMYLNEKFPQHPLLPKDVQKKAINYQVANIVCSNIKPYLSKSTLEFMRVKLGPGVDIAWAQRHIKIGFEALEKLLTNWHGEYATGDEIFLADLFLAPQINDAKLRFNVKIEDFPVLNKIYGNYFRLKTFH